MCALIVITFYPIDLMTFPFFVFFFLLLSWSLKNVRCSMNRFIKGHTNELLLFLHFCTLNLAYIQFSPICSSSRSKSRFTSNSSIEFFFWYLSTNFYLFSSIFLQYFLRSKFSGWVLVKSKSYFRVIFFMFWLESCYQLYHFEFTKLIVDIHVKLLFPFEKS